MNLDCKIRDVIRRYKASGIEQQVDYEKFNLYSVIDILAADLERQLKILYEDTLESLRRIY